MLAGDVDNRVEGSERVDRVVGERFEDGPSAATARVEDSSVLGQVDRYRFDERRVLVGPSVGVVCFGHVIVVGHDCPGPRFVVAHAVAGRLLARTSVGE